MYSRTGKTIGLTEVFFFKKKKGVRKCSGQLNIPNTMDDLQAPSTQSPFNPGLAFCQNATWEATKALLQRRFFPPPLCFSALSLFGQLVLMEILILYFTHTIFPLPPKKGLPAPLPPPPFPPPPSSTTLLTEKFSFSVA